ncbi:MAG: hypothetical protein ACLUIS_00925 [Longibaculum sp.]
MEIKPTSMTTNILMTVINEKPEAFAYVQGNKISVLFVFILICQEWL